jgi:DNA replication protein DnaC
MDDETQLAQASDMIQQQQHAHPRSAGPAKLAATIDRIMNRIDNIVPPTDEEIRAAAFDAQTKERARRASEWSRLVSRLGRRYAEADLDSFQAATQPQEIVKAKVAEYIEHVEDNVLAGRGVLLYGPPGTGKDHLATAIMRAAILDAGMTVTWTDGADFYGLVRDRIDSAQSEANLVYDFRAPDLLAMSDPIPPLGRVDSAYQLSMLFRIIDKRYRENKATLVTLNVADRAEAEQRLSPNIIDRLAHGALACHCNWPSYRR